MITHTELQEAKDYVEKFTPFPAGDDERDTVIEALSLLLSDEYVIVPKEPVENQLHIINKSFNLHPDDNKSTRFAYDKFIEYAPKVIDE